MTHPGPDFLLLGAMKAGTSSLFHYICEHPLMLRPSSKEIHYYDRYIYQGWTLEDYLAEFPEKPSGFISGEATPSYLLRENVPNWVRADFPDIKLLVILRNPVDRAYSHYNQRRQKGKEERDFFDLIRIEDEKAQIEWERARADPSHNINFESSGSSLSRGRYAEQLSNWMRVFPRDRFLILFTEELLTEPATQMKKVFDHIELPAQPVDTSKRKNKRTYDPMRPEARKWLTNYYAEHNVALEHLLGRKLPW